MHGHARLRERNQITVPSFVVEIMKLEAGNIVEFVLNDRGTVELHAAKIVKVRTPEARLEEEAAKREIERGEYTAIHSADDLHAYVEQVRKGQERGDADPDKKQVQNVEMVAEIGSPVEFEITLPAEMTGGSENVRIQCKGRVVRAAGTGKAARDTVSTPTPATVMARSLKIARRFGRRLGALFEEFDERADELQAKLDKLILGFQSGEINQAPQNHPSDGTCFLPLIDDYDAVFWPDQSTLHHRDNTLQENVMDFSQATHIDVLTIEGEK